MVSVHRHVPRRHTTHWATATTAGGQASKKRQYQRKYSVKTVQPSVTWSEEINSCLVDVKVIRSEQALHKQRVNININMTDFDPFHRIQHAWNGTHSHCFRFLDHLLPSSLPSWAWIASTLVCLNMPPR